MCKNYGQRVQNSVFECRVSEAQYESFRAKLIEIMDAKIDNLRLYKLPAPREKNLESYGIDKYTDFDEPLVF